MDEKLVYMAGNGKMCATYRYGTLREAFGPPYSSPSAFASDFSDTYDKLPPTKEPLCAIWYTPLKKDGVLNATLTDFVPPHLPALVRLVESTVPVTVNLFPYKEGLLEYVYQIEANAYLIKTKNGNAIYNDYPLAFPQYYVVYAKGDVRTALDGERISLTTCGTSELYLIGGPDYPDAICNFEAIKDTSYADLFDRTRKYWVQLFEGIPVYNTLKAKEFYRKSDTLKAIEDTVTCIITQQSDEGGVLAGYHYHLGYVRDQFGVAEGLLSLGMYSHAKKILDFYVNTFRQYGKILNAQAMGAPGIFHFAENDKVEITGYLILQFFRYASLSGDKEFLEENTDLLKWLYQQQVSELSDATLPFNGDETYIAGGLLPRDVISDASAEATLLFLYSGELLAEFLKEHGECTDDMRSLLDEVRNSFPKHFIRDGKYYINDPDRKAELPRFRYGVCMNSCDSHFYFGWTQLTKKNRYVCASCLRQDDTAERVVKRYALPSSLLMPAYLGIKVDGITPAVISCVRALTLETLDKGLFFSNEQLLLNVGYDYGLLLVNILELGLDNAKEIFDKVLDLRDSVGVWSEYFINGKPFNTRYRPWESAINISAVVKYVQTITE